MNKQDDIPAPVAPSTVLSKEELQALYERILASGALGRSKVYGALLAYLLEAASQGRSPKEIEIALDVLGRDASFDVSRDSVVRVYIHQLRKRLNDYYEKHESAAPYRIIIPKGQYTIAAISTSAAPSPEEPAASLRRSWQWPGIAALMLLVGFGLAYLLFGRMASGPQSPLAEAARHPLWSSIMDDDLPVLLVMGDYYIFGELDEFGRITRMVRDFGINSSADLSARTASQPELEDRYLDLNLNYIPEGSALALSRIMSMLQWGNKTVNVTMMSKLSTADLRSNHIVYIGYVSALGSLNRLVFASSGLRIGRTYDELYNQGTGEVYSSDAGLPSREQPYRDYGLLSTFPSPTGNQFLIVTGARDAGLMYSAQAVINAAELDAIDASLQLRGQGSNSFEALHEVFGFERTNFDGNLVYSRQLDARRIWSGNAVLP